MPIRFIRRVITVVEEDFAVAFKGQDVRGHAVKEPAIMADHHHATNETLHAIFQGTHGVDVDVIGRFIQQDDIGAFLQHARQMHAIALAARQASNNL